MRNLLNFGFAWLSIVLVVLLTVIYILKRLIRKSDQNGEPLNVVPNRFLTKANRFLRKHHKFFGICLVITGLVHGLFSSDELLSLNVGTLAWLVSILLGINFMIRKKLGKFKGWMAYHRLLTVIFLCTIVWHVVDVGGIQVQNVLFNESSLAESAPVITSSIFSTDENDADAESDTSGSVLLLADGTYTGEATGYRDGLQVSVSVENGLIAKIDVTDHNEVNAKYYAEPIDLIPEAIIEAQTTEVDTISGATFTSVGIINAVNDALSDAVVSGTLPESQALPEARSERGGHHKIRP